MSEANRVLQIVTKMGYGGLEAMLMNYYRHIDRSRIQFDFLAHRPEKGDYDVEIRALGGEIYHVPQVNPFSHEYLQALDHFFAQHPYRVVHSHIDCMSAYPLRAAKKAGVQKRIAHVHNASQKKDLKYPIKLISKGKIAKYATDLYACGRAAGDWMYGGEPYTVLNNAIDTADYIYNAQIRQEVRTELGIESGLVAGHVGSLKAVKNQSFLLDVFAGLHAQIPESRLLLIGDGEDRKALEQKAAGLHLDGSVIFTGVRGDVHRLLQAMDVFVFPSLFEGLPVSLIEAQAAGLPCIVSDRVPEECRVTEHVRFLSLKRTPEEWAQIVQKAAGLRREDTSAQIRAAGFDVTENVKQLEALYRSGFDME